MAACSASSRVPRARVVVYDVLFSEPDFLGRYAVGGREITGNESDAELISAVRRAGNVVGAADAVFQGFEHAAVCRGRPTPRRIQLPGTIYTPGPGSSRGRMCKPPFEALRDAVPALGHNYLRRMTAAWRDGWRRSSSIKASPCRRSGWPRSCWRISCRPRPSSSTDRPCASATRACRSLTDN